MKIFTCHFVLVLIYLVKLMPTQSENMPVRREKTANLMGIIEAILIDPEFTALSPQQQLRVLLIIYNTLEKKSLKTQQDTSLKKK